MVPLSVQHTGGKVRNRAPCEQQEQLRAVTGSAPKAVCTLGSLGQV